MSQRARAVVGAAALAPLWVSAAAAEPEAAVRVVGERPAPGLESRATSTVRRAELEERLPRSAPDALRYEPGVTVQQTAHGQGAPIVRGLYGSRVLIAYDGVRLNNATFRQGPGQYFFTLDAHNIDSITVLRGGASTLFGTDALGGALLVCPVLPRFDAPDFQPHWTVRALGTVHSADARWLTRGTAELQRGDWAALVGASRASAGQLRSSGPVLSPATGQLPEVPRFARDGVTQLGTGYELATGDGTLRRRLGEDLTAIAAINLFRQWDSPRTDQCPPPFGVIGDCLTYEEQFRSLVYLGLDGDLGSAARKSKLRVSYQRQHEATARNRPLSFVSNHGIDNVSTWGASAALVSARLPLDDSRWVDFFWGGDAYLDLIESSAWVSSSDGSRVTPYARGQFLDGSSYTNLGGYLRGELNQGQHLTATLGGRVGLASAALTEDPESGAPARRSSWPTTGAELRSQVRPVPWLELTVGLDQSYRTPNLTDLSQRQQTGPGFQLDNPALDAERQWTLEAGAAVKTERLRIDAWAYRAIITGMLTMVPRSVEDCPVSAQQESCRSSWSRYQLVNAPSQSTIHGVEGAIRYRPVPALKVQATVGATTGVGPNLLGAVPWGTEQSRSATAPLSRIPPLNGTLEARYQLPFGVVFGAAARWSAAQTRLSVSDQTDYRIPVGGTPGFFVVDLRAGYRLGRALVLHAQLENLLDQPYRVHGSSVNGAGRGVALSVEAGL